jgi:hypothetical protein
MHKAAWNILTPGTYPCVPLPTCIRMNTMTFLFGALGFGAELPNEIRVSFQS